MSKHDNIPINVAVDSLVNFLTNLDVVNPLNDRLVESLDYLLFYGGTRSESQAEEKAREVWAAIVDYRTRRNHYITNMPEV